MITIICSGSRGDFQPYIALAQEIKTRGHNVRITGGPEYKSYIESYGVECFPLTAGLSNTDVDPELLKAAGSSDNPLKMLHTFNKMKNYGKLLTGNMYAACEGSELIIYHPGCTVGYFAALELGIPAVMAAPFPMHKTKEHLSVIMYGKSKYNRMNVALSYKMIQTMLWMASSGSLKALWKKQFGRMPKNYGCPYEKVSARYPAVISCSNHVFPRPKDWNDNIHQYGYWFVRETEEYTPSPALKQFLNDGEKPVYIGFGSMTSIENHDALFQMAVDALQKAGKRGIVSGLRVKEGLPDAVFSIDVVPHSWLFPQMKAVCHHGGAGTTAAGFYAGVPSVIIPFSNDQFAWAHRAHDLQVGAAPVYKKNLTANALAEAISSATQPEIVLNAKRLGEKIANENGVTKTADVILGCLER